MNTLELQQIESIPQQLLVTCCEELYTLFPTPTLLHLQGRSQETVFISVLLHGNESTGYYVVQELLKKYQHLTLPRSISIYFGNTQAARYGKRFLNYQPDYNRVWPGTSAANFQESIVMKKIVDEMKGRNLFASIDIHNNTGLNPHYACINKLENRFLRMAALFGHTVVYFLTPKGVQSMAFSKLCPAVTLECGKSDSSSGLTHALEYVDAILHLQNISNKPVLPQDMNLFHTIARVKIPENTTFSFSNKNADILLGNGLDKMNFSEVPADTCFGILQTNNNTRLHAFNDDEEEVGENLFYINDQKIMLKKPMMPAMLTQDEGIIRQDCLCYLMERLPLIQ